MFKINEEQWSDLYEELLAAVEEALREEATFDDCTSAISSLSVAELHSFITKGHCRVIFDGKTIVISRRAEGVEEKPTTEGQFSQAIDLLTKKARNCLDYENKDRLLLHVNTLKSLRLDFLPPIESAKYKKIQSDIQTIEKAMEIVGSTDELSRKQLQLANEIAKILEAV